MKSDITAQNLVSALSRNFRIRILTDYDVMIEVSEDLANDVINDAKEFLKEVDTIISADTYQKKANREFT